MQHAPSTDWNQRLLITSRRFQFAGALLIGALLPFAVRDTVLPGLFGEPASVNALIGNGLAIAIAFWMRLSIETYPGIRSTYVIFPTALTAHGIIVFAFLLSRLPYDRLALGAGFALHVLWIYLIAIYAEFRKTVLTGLGSRWRMTSFLSACAGTAADVHLSSSHQECRKRTRQPASAGNFASGT